MLDPAKKAPARHSPSTLVARTPTSSSSSEPMHAPHAAALIASQPVPWHAVGHSTMMASSDDTTASAPVYSDPLIAPVMTPFMPMHPHVHVQMELAHMLANTASEDAATQVLDPLPVDLSAPSPTVTLEQQLYEAQMLQEVLGEPERPVHAPETQDLPQTSTTQSFVEALMAELPVSPVTTTNASPIATATSPSSDAVPKQAPLGRTCNFAGCHKGVRSRGLCKAHGGGRRCRTPGCTTSDQGGGHCVLHGGGKRCEVEGCAKSAQWKNRCKVHGGARKCKYQGCTRNGQVKQGYCRHHHLVLTGRAKPRALDSPPRDTADS